MARLSAFVVFCFCGFKIPSFSIKAPPSFSDTPGNAFTTEAVVRLLLGVFPPPPPPPPPLVVFIAIISPLLAGKEEAYLPEPLLPSQGDVGTSSENSEPASSRLDGDIVGDELGKNSEVL